MRPGPPAAMDAPRCCSTKGSRVDGCYAWLLAQDLTEGAVRHRFASGLAAAPTGSPVAVMWLQRLRQMEQCGLLEMEESIAASRSALQTARDTAERALVARAASLTDEAQRKTSPLLARLAAASENVRQQGRALGYSTA